jgi:ABC-type multidrug transport system ATPase subunit
MSEYIASNSDDRIAILWTDMSFTIRSTFRRNETQVLNALTGCAEFGSLMAVMGPSGAGLTTLLKCFNGRNNWGLSADSRVRLSSVTTIRSTFIGQNEKEFLIMGLTAKQNMIYASKLKNSREGVEMDHEMNVRTVMSDLMLTDIMDTKAESCSGGELKRLAIAVELTALHKPNLILCDEPTTGLDSNIAEVVSNGTDM